MHKYQGKISLLVCLTSAPGELFSIFLTLLAYWLLTQAPAIICVASEQDASRVRYRAESVSFWPCLKFYAKAYFISMNCVEICQIRWS
jgi:hypothetical protein